MRQGEGNHKVNETCTVTLICGRDLQSNPRANITWIDPDGNEVVNKENYSQDDGPGVIQLHIKRVNRRDRGQWTCKRDFNVCVYDCSGDEKLLNGNQDGQQPQTECSRKSFTNTSVINLDVFCKYKVGIGLQVPNISYTYKCMCSGQLRWPNF